MKTISEETESVVYHADNRFGLSDIIMSSRVTGHNYIRQTSVLKQDQCFVLFNLIHTVISSF